MTTIILVLLFLGFVCFLIAAQNGWASPFNAMPVGLALWILAEILARFGGALR